MSGSKKVVFSTSLPPAVAQRLRAVVVGLKAQGLWQTSVASATEDAVVAWCARMEADHNGGEPFPIPDAPIPSGRPVNIPAE